jgi:uncharacterized NAD(P)/FAD-binding protein YdhS
MDIGPIVATLHLPDPTVSSPRRPGETISRPIALGPATAGGPSLRDLARLVAAAALVVAALVLASLVPAAAAVS